METMTAEERISKYRDECNEARQDLRDALAEVDAKVELVKSSLRPKSLAENHPTTATLIAAALGFLIGTCIKRRATGPIMIAAVSGFALWIRSSPAASESNANTTVSPA
jgi:ElaB/YqjD/DUF883 family membrane-anchored ribosome-binding protein